MLLAVVDHMAALAERLQRAGAIARVRFLRGEEKLRHATVLAIRAA
jgi:hypothetical protein